MCAAIDEDTIRGWIDRDLVATIERIDDDHAEFNVLIEMSNLSIHIIRREPTGPVLIGQEIAYSESVQSRISALTPAARKALIARLRETLTAAPVIYGFVNDRGENVIFEDMERVFLESRIYPDGLDEHTLMTRLLDVWKVMRYLDDLPNLVDAVEGER